MGQVGSFLIILENIKNKLGLFIFRCISYKRELITSFCVLLQHEYINNCFLQEIFVI